MDDSVDFKDLKHLLLQLGGVQSAIVALSPEDKLPLDSMGMVNFAVALEDRYGIRFRPEAHDILAIFANLRSLREFISRERQASL